VSSARSALAVLGALAAGLVLCAAGTASAPSGTDTALLRKIVLAPSQVGAGYQLSQIPGGQKVQGEVTLDFCHGTYPSESLRTARLQVAYSAHGNAYQASNEVVAYRPGGAQQALGEVKREVAICPRAVQVVSDPRLLPGSIAILESVSGVINGTPQTGYMMAAYQVRGNVLSGVYGFGPSAASAQAHTLHAAEQSAGNLKNSLHNEA
jgi:hypothetical protein